VGIDLLEGRHGRHGKSKFLENLTYTGIFNSGMWVNYNMDSK
jgi:hypothetical protein